MEYNKPHRIVNGQIIPLTEEEILQFSQESEENNLKRQNDYVSKRKEEYPPITEQLDMIYHFGVDYWKEEITKIKEKYPKI